MTHVGPSPMASASVRPQTGTSFVEWSAIFAGAVLAAALSFVFLTFGTAIGLSFTSPWPNAGGSAKFIAAVAILWVMVQQIGAFMAGGYVAGRLRSRWHETTEHEIEFRDGIHGALVWAVGLVIGAAMLMATAGAAARVGVEVAGKAAATVSSTDAMDGVLDSMLRPVSVAQAQGAPPASAPTARPQPSGAANTENPRAEIARIMASSLASGSMTPQDRTYVAQIVAQRTGIPQPEAEKRVSDALNTAREAADKTRRAALLAGFVTAAGLVVSFGAAWWAAMKGGQHRDNSIPARFEFGNRMRRPGAPST